MKNTYKSISFCLFVLYVLFSGNVFGQGEANTWYFGTHIGIDFNTGTQLNNGNHDTGTENGEGVSTLSNAAGAFLFMSDGTDVRDLSGTFTGGTGLLGSKSSTQSAIIVPVPGSTTLYHLFTVPCEEASGAYTTGGSKDPADGVRYNVVNPGTRTVTNKNTQFSPVGVPVTEGMTAVPDFAGTGYWVIYHQAGDKVTPAASNTFYAYHVHPGNTNATTGVITLAAADKKSFNLGTGIMGALASGPNPASSNGQILIKANSCFNRVALVHSFKSKLVEVFTFDNSTGAMTGPKYSLTNFQAGDPNELYGLEFSPDGKSVFVGVLGQNFGAASTGRAMYQFNVTSEVTGTINTAGNTSRRTTTVAANGLGQLQLGPDGNIYYSHHFNNPIGSGSSNAYVGQISSPNSFPATFDDDYYTWDASNGANGASKMGLPQIYKGFVAGQLDFGDDLPTVAGVKIICQNTSVNFSINFTGTMKPGTLDVDWGDGNVQTNIAGTPTSVSHTYTTTGNKTVTITFEDICDNPYNVTTPLTVVAAPTGSITCLAPDKLKFDVTSTVNATSTYIWFKTAGGADAWGTGTSLTTPALTAPFPSDVYLLEANGSGGTVTTLNPTAPTDNFGAVVTNRITVLKQVYMQSFDVKPYTNSTCTGTVTATIKNSSNVTMATVTVNSPSACGALTIPISVLLPADTYTITMSSTGSIAGFNYMQNWHASVPYTATGLMSDFGVSGSAGGDAGPAFNYKLINAQASCPARIHITAACSLPVTWLDFTGLRSNKGVVLNWSTAIEENNRVFHVQRSIDGVNFVTIGDVLSLGNGNAVHHYDYTDVNAPTGYVYYRLVQEDINGASSNSRIIVLGPAGKLDLTLVPNPGDGSFAITGLSGDVKLNIEVYTVTGQSIYSATAYAGQVINLDGVAKGFYVVKVVSGNSEQSIRYINQ